MTSDEPETGDDGGAQNPNQTSICYADHHEGVWATVGFGFG